VTVTQTVQHNRQCDAWAEQIKATTVLEEQLTLAETKNAG